MGIVAVVGKLNLPKQIPVNKVKKIKGAKRQEKGGGRRLGTWRCERGVEKDGEKKGAVGEA